MSAGTVLMTLAEPHHSHPTPAPSRSTSPPIPGGARVSIEHRDLPLEASAMHAIGWPHFLKRLAIAGNGGDPGPDPFATTPPSPARTTNRGA